MKSPPASLTFSASSLISFLYFASSSLKVLRALRISSSSVSPKPVASAISSSVYCILFISDFARNSALPPSIISVPRPAIFVAMVTAPNLPACATISASFSWFLAFKTLCGILSFLRSFERISLFSMLIVPTRIGCPFSWHSFICSIALLNLALSVWKITSGKSSRRRGLFVGISTTSSL